MYHVALGVPVLVLPISKYFDELLENSRLAAATSLSKLGGIMVMAVNLPVVLVVAILRPKDCWAEGASEVVNVVFAIERRDVGAP